MKYNETLNTLSKCFDEINSLVVIITERLRDSDIPLRALFVEFWPEFTISPLTYRIWDGVEYRKAVDGDYHLSSILHADEILKIVKRKEILMRKFSI